MREVCGAVCGSAMVVGLKCPELDKAGVYEKVRVIADEIKKNHPSIICRELLKIKEGSPISPAPDARDANYYATRPCAKIVENASEIVEKYILK